MPSRAEDAATTVTPPPPGSSLAADSFGGQSAASRIPSGAVTPQPAPGPAAAGDLAEIPEKGADPDEEGAPQDQRWKELLNDASDDSSEADAPTRGPDDNSGEDSGEDSDELPASAHADRRKNDIDILYRQQQVLRSTVTSRSPTSAAAQNGATAPAAKAKAGSDAANAGNGASVANETSVQAAGGWIGAARDEEEDEEEIASPMPSPQRKSLMARFFKSKSTSSFERNPAIRAEINKLESGNLSMLKDTQPEEHDDDWFQQRLPIYQRDGLACTKVATNGKTYDRRIHLDPRNLTIEIRGGRTGEKGIMLDDLVDVTRGMDSAEFELFYVRVIKCKKEAENEGLAGPGAAKELASRACVLVTPNRTFSFIFALPHLRENLGQCIRHLLTSNNRGVLATGGTPTDSKPPTGKAPRDGTGMVRYPNRSSYVGQFQGGKRHGFGVLILSDGTRYEAEWKNDERHGDGKEFCPDGTTFSGCYVKGMRHGAGEMTWPEGSKYSGQFERGRANGEGQLLRTDGSVYQGQFSEDCMSGHGVMEWRDGVAYNGQFNANRREGFGKMKWSSGRWSSYEGEWKDGLQHGEGTLNNHEGQSFRGVFRSGKLERWLDDA